ncbi:twin-arginine translocase subunit TatC [Halobellus captivus]|uniref:twin-arginine translocase subunit TatC n=1 Tax=Halobellus captivus TaxID=2592614 RepID=UPI00119E5DC6
MAEDSEDADRTPDADDAEASGTGESVADSETDASPDSAESDADDARASDPDSSSSEADGNAESDGSENAEAADASATGDEGVIEEGTVGEEAATDTDEGDTKAASSNEPEEDADNGKDDDTDNGKDDGASDEPSDSGEEVDSADTESDADTDASGSETADEDSEPNEEPDTDSDAESEPDSETDVQKSEEEGEDADEEEKEEKDAATTGTDGGAPATAGDVLPGDTDDMLPEEDSTVDDGLLSGGPESDEEMPLADHIEEMVRRLTVVLGIGGLITLLLYPGADLVNSAFGLNLISSTEVIDFLWNKHIPGAPEMVDRRPRIYGPLELLLTELKVAALGGLVVGLPAFVYETYLFMRPGLYSKERRYYLAAVPTSLVLAFVGISFAHFIVLPAIFAYFTSYTTGTAIVAFGLKETFNLILILMGYNAIIFQIPLFVMLAIMMNLVTRRWLEDRRLLFWGTFLGLAFLVSPDPTGMAPIIIGATMIALFEGTLFVLRWAGRGSLAPTAEGLAARRPLAAVLAALVGYLLSPLPVPTGYYHLLPSVVVETLAANGLAVYTPLIIAGALVGTFELVSLLLRRYGRSRRILRVSLATDTARRSVWLVAVVVGYLGSPDPAVLRWATELNLHPALAGGIAVGLVLGYEAIRLLLASRENRAG